MENKLNEPQCEDSTPDPEYLIKSIAEQGYSLETSLADLIDNSISANADKIEILIKMDEEPFVLFLADNGDGMNEETLSRNMKFPSDSPDNKRKSEDLGRFGLGMKTASFSQTRCFTVLSRKRGALRYSGKTWDVDYLKKFGWKIKINTSHEIDTMLEAYNRLSSDYHNSFENYTPNTIIVWKGLYKFEQHIEEETNRQNALKKELTEVTSDYLSLVFHRFMERRKLPLQIRINNSRIKPFNPFPTEEKDFRRIEYKEANFRNDFIKLEGFILPSRSIDEGKNGISVWATKNRGLMDMEGIYVYRADRIILFGNWLGLIKKGPRLQLARLRFEVGNTIDHLLHLNVAKSQIIIPHDLIKAFERYIDELRIEAEREFYNRGVKKFSNNAKEKNINLFERKASSKGILLEFNNQFPLLKTLKNELNDVQLSKLNLLLRMINIQINKIRQSHDDRTFVGIEEKDGISIKDLIHSISVLKESGLSSADIKKEILPGLGFKEASLPIELNNYLK